MMFSYSVHIRECMSVIEEETKQGVDNMGNIYLGITIILYLIAAFLFVFTVVKKHQTYEGYEVGWISFRLKIRKWFIGSSILGCIFNILYIFTR